MNDDTLQTIDEALALSLGQHQIHIEKTGYESRDTIINIDKYERIELGLHLNKLDESQIAKSEKSTFSPRSSVMVRFPAAISPPPSIRPEISWSRGVGITR